MSDLFDSLATVDAGPVTLAPGAVLLSGFAAPEAEALHASVLAVTGRAPFRHLSTRRGGTMSVAMSNCGQLGWVSDRRGYRYEATDPTTALPWPPMPELFTALAVRAATRAGYADFTPDACLLNRYAPPAGMGLHQDRDELDLAQPIVSVSLGLPATFLFGGLVRAERPRRWRLESGDVVVWGGASRLAFHGVSPLKPGTHTLTGDVRYNLTFRRVSTA